jgi:hypothetical protein
MSAAVAAADEAVSSAAVSSRHRRSNSCSCLQPLVILTGKRFHEPSSNFQLPSSTELLPARSHNRISVTSSAFVHLVSCSAEFPIACVAARRFVCCVLLRKVFVEACLSRKAAQCCPPPPSNTHQSPSLSIAVLGQQLLFKINFIFPPHSFTHQTSHKSCFHWLVCRFLVRLTLSRFSTCARLSRQHTRA